MGFFDWFRMGQSAPLRDVRAPVRPGEVRSLENPTTPISSSAILTLLGMGESELQPVSLDRALQIPAFLAGYVFLPNTLSSLPLQLFRAGDDGSEKLSGGVATLLHDAPNPETTSFDLRRRLWQDYFGEMGRGLIWIERGTSGTPLALWNMDPRQTRVTRENGRKFYWFAGQRDPYPAADVIDMVWLPKPDGLGCWSLVQRGSRAINDLLSMQAYSSRLFSKGGVPPLSLEGELPTTGREALARAQKQIAESIQQAADSNSPIVQIPAGFKLNKLGVEPDKGQMVEAKRLGIEDMARLFGLPPVFLQDLTHGTFSNTEQQDLHLVKHRVVQLCSAFEQELNLKLFGQRSNRRFARHNVDGLLRGDFLSRMDGITKAVMGGVLKPNEGRDLLDLPRSEQAGADQLHIQGGTVPLGSAAEDGASDEN